VAEFIVIRKRIGNGLKPPILPSHSLVVAMEAPSAKVIPSTHSAISTPAKKSLEALTASISAPRFFSAIPR